MSTTLTDGEYGAVVGGPLRGVPGAIGVPGVIGAPDTGVPGVTGAPEALDTEPGAEPGPELDIFDTVSDTVPDGPVTVVRIVVPASCVASAGAVVWGLDTRCAGNPGGCGVETSGLLIDP